MNKYTVDYFINKFNKIPSKEWTVGTFDDENGRRCAYGHCGITWQKSSTREAIALDRLFERLHKKVDLVNDNFDGFPQKTPKGRILAALRKIKAIQDKE